MLALADDVRLGSMATFKTVGVNYGALRKECLEAIRRWPGCETIAGIQIFTKTRGAVDGLAIQSWMLWQQRSSLSSWRETSENCKYHY